MFLTRSLITKIINKLTIFTGKGDYLVAKIDKKMPDIIIAAKSISLEPETNVLIFNSSNGTMGIILAAIYQDTSFFLYDSNIQNSNLSKKNLEINYEYTKNVHTTSEISTEKLMDTAIYNITSGYTALSTITENVGLIKKTLKKEGKFYLITHTKVGARRHENIVKNIFGNVATLSKGNGGYRVFRSINEGRKSIREQNNKKEKVKFSIFGKQFSLLTKPGIFSKSVLDLGTKFLLENSPIFNFNKLLDFGCGWGPIGLVASIFNPQGKVILVDIDSKAVDVAQENIKRLKLTDRVKALGTDDVTTIGERFDLILSNPPLHTNTADLIEMFKKIKEVMEKNGKFYMVIEKTYVEKFKQILGKIFVRYEITNHNDRYFIIRVQM